MARIDIRSIKNYVSRLTRKSNENGWSAGMTARFSEITSVDRGETLKLSSIYVSRLCESRFFGITFERDPAKKCFPGGTQFSRFSLVPSSFSLFRFAVQTRIERLLSKTLFSDDPRTLL